MSQKSRCPFAHDAETAAASAAVFDELDRVQTDREVDPYTPLAERRSRCPVQPFESAGGLADVVPGYTDIYEVLTHEGISQVLRDGETFSSTIYADSIELVMGHTILGMDEPAHGRYRSIIQKAFTKSGLARWEDELVRPIVHSCIDRFQERGHADLVKELTFPFPVSVIAGMLGLPREHLVDFHRLAIELISIAVDPAKGIEASAQLEAMFMPLIQARRRSPDDDLISLLTQAEVDGEQLSDADICSFLRLLLPAGAETTYRSSSNLFYGLLTHTDQLDAVRADHSLFPQAMEEGLRWEPPLLMIMRGVTRDVELEGVQLRAGQGVRLSLGAANRDDGRHADPDRFDILRNSRTHMAFGFGSHRCLGMHLARMETLVVLEAVLDRLPGLRLDPEAADVKIIGSTFRSPASLPVLFG